MLKKIRITLAILMFIAVNLLFLGLFRHYLAWTVKIQFLPAVMAANVGVITAIVACCLIFGRIYCSIICPLGTMQDAFAWLGKKHKKNRYSHSNEKKYLRYSVLIVFVISLILGFAPVTTLLAPYSAYGRIVNSLFRPLYDLLQNAFALIENQYQRYTIDSPLLWLRSVSTLCIAIATLCLLAFLSWRNGRTYCNTVCPVGTTLSFFSRFALFKIHFDEDKCRNCSLCEKNCKAAAIDFKQHTVDYSRCVVCGDCTAACKFDALHYGLTKKRSNSDSALTSNSDSALTSNSESALTSNSESGLTSNSESGLTSNSESALTSNSESALTSNSDSVLTSVQQSKRAFITATAAIATTAAIAQSKVKVDGGLAIIEKKKQPNRQTQITPPGSVSDINMKRHCTACQLCVSACPNNVLRPSSNPLTLMQPVMSFEHGYCRTGCTRCSHVCPTGAIRPLSKPQKTAVHVGYAQWIHHNCVPLRDGVECGNCARHCPTNAITMVPMVARNITLPDGSHPTVNIPSINTDKCIGCGKCEYLCPSRPFPAIYVEGHQQHIIS